jgi:ubiquinone/menaquinone biosynthesis C-methylase UbiE
MSPGWRQYLRRWHPQGIPWPASVLYNEISRSGIFERHYQLVADDLAGYCRSGRALDIGTGPGRLLLAIRRTLPDMAVTGADISQAMVATAVRNMKQAGFSGSVEVIQAAADDLPFPDDLFDLVVSTGSLHHWKDAVAGLNEVFRVLKPGRNALMYDLVKSMPPALLKQARDEFGLFRTALLWMHSFEEPFYCPDEMEALASSTLFGKGETRFAGMLCCLVLKKPGAAGEGDGTGDD